MNIVPNPLTGKHIAALFVACFSVIIAVNLTLAFNAVRTFPGIEVKNAYIASQQFDAKRTAQTQLNWNVSARIEKGNLVLSIMHQGQPVDAEIVSALFGRATHTAEDQQLLFAFNGKEFVSPVDAGQGNWNLRLSALSPEGIAFEQRIIVGRER